MFIEDRTNDVVLNTVADLWSKSAGWEALARKRGVTLPDWPEKPTARALKDWAERLGLVFGDVFLRSTPAGMARNNPERPLRALVGFMLEWMERNPRWFYEETAFERRHAKFAQWERELGEDAYFELVQRAGMGPGITITAEKFAALARLVDAERARRSRRP